MTRKTLLSSREYWIAQWQLSVFNLLENYRIAHNLNQTQLAEKLGVTKGYISQILNGNFDHKMSKLIDLALALGKTPSLQFQDIPAADPVPAIGKTRTAGTKTKLPVSQKRNRTASPRTRKSAGASML